ncbi:hypothetical protein [Nocardia sp. NPDC127526]|uniref:hypothetical protein n=1 Tax=Nocardia sp. NPDC127526 TaxID=3345393 RepID=UPI0036315C08
MAYSVWPEAAAVMAIASVAEATSMQKYPDQAAKRFRVTHRGVVSIFAALPRAGRRNLGGDFDDEGPNSDQL